MEDSALLADEGRGKLRKVLASRMRALNQEFPNRTSF